MNAFIERYLLDDVLEEAYEDVVCTAQRPSEDELVSSDRLHNAALACPNIFAESQLINLYLKGLFAPIHPSVSDNSHGKSYPALAELALKHGKSYRAERRQGDTHRGSSFSKSGKLPRFLLHGHARLDRRDYAEESSEDSSDEEIESLEPIPDRDKAVLVTPDVRSSDKPSASARPTTWLQPNHRKLAEDFLPKSTDSWRSWLCRENEHSMLECPYTTEDQRKFAAYAMSCANRKRSGISATLRGESPDNTAPRGSQTCDTG